MTSRSDLDRLCACFNIAISVRGEPDQEQPVPEATKRALLRGMGIEADPEADRRNLEAALDREWRRILPPVLVVWEDAKTLEVDLHLPPSPEDRPTRWVLTEEGGKRSSGGDLDLAPLPILERRRILAHTWERRRLTLSLPAALGYHRLELFVDTIATCVATCTLIRAPRRVYTPKGIGADQRLWGLAAPLPAVRSARNWGIGDFTDLLRLLEQAAEAGAGALAPSPLHALFPHEPERCDPHQPGSRAFLNELFLDVEAIPELGECEAAQAAIAAEDFQARLRALRASPAVDYPAVVRAKREILESLFRHFRSQHLNQNTDRDRAFRAFRDAQGEPLRRFALFAALGEYLANDAPGGPRDWPEPYRRAEAKGVADFAAEHSERIDFFIWLQWQAQQQLQAVGRRSLELGLALGLCPELAVAPAPDGAEVWSRPQLYVQGATLIAPVDTFSPEGRDLGVLAWHPIQLREAAYAPLIAVLRCAMRDAGALRLNQVMGLIQPLLMPSGMNRHAAASVLYPRDELLGILALESQRNRCLLIAADPTHPMSVLQEALAPLEPLSLRLLYFERDEQGGFLPPSGFASHVALSANSSELPNLTGFWAGADLELRRTLDLFATEQDYEEQLLQRGNDRARLLLALEREGLAGAEASADPIAVPNLTAQHIHRIYLYLARTRCELLLIQLGDLLGGDEPVQLSGVGESHSSWRQRLPLELECWPEEPRVAELLAAMREERGSAPRVSPPPKPRPQQGGNAGAVIPRATYRLQLHADFGFSAAADLVPYLAKLGISHCYFSPYLQARPGSTHGYDVIAHDRLNPELGGAPDFERLCVALAEHGMGQILDMVPNHVGVMGADNLWWLNVLENGEASEYATFFDIDWQPLRQELQGKILIPVLGGYYGDVLDRGELVLGFADGGFYVDYYEHRFPVDPRAYPRILEPGLERLRERLGPASQDLLTFESLVTAFGKLPPRQQLDEEAQAERRRDKELHKQRLAALCADAADLAHYVEECLRNFNGAAGYPADPDRLHRLLEAQAYRLAHWRVAADQINYRRFFDINDLAALRMENPAVFDATHALALDLVAQGKIQGLRIDHPDGLYDPAAYFARIQAQVAAPARQTLGSASSEAGDGIERPLYLVVEKILVGDEPLPADWPVHGTTGYEHAALVDALLVDESGEQRLDSCYRELAGHIRPLADEEYKAKHLVMRNLLSSELNVLASELSRIAELDPHTRDYTLEALRNALAEVVACFPVYRTYITGAEISTGDRNQILKALAEARRRSKAADLSVFSFLQDLLLGTLAQGKPEAYRARMLRLTRKLQQYTGPVTAKGVEDTAFYRYHRLVSLNEVGADPERFGIGVDDFHRAMARRRETWPHAMLASSTHDNKRSEDVRARLHVLSELPDEWQEHVQRWTRLHRRFRRVIDAGAWPDANTEYLLYQTLLGAWPLNLTTDRLTGEALDAFRSRVIDYLQKAVREAKVHTAWTNENAEYEEALAAFTTAVLDSERNGAFFEDFLPFWERVARLGLYNSLSATVLRLTTPGVPDTYQGSELWGFHLVDPDNRRPVDYDLRHTLLSELEERLVGGSSRADLARELTTKLEDGRAKLYLIQTALQLRREDPDLFALGDYRPLTVEGTHAKRLCAFARTRNGRSLVAFAPRLLAELTDPVKETRDPFADPGWASTFVEVPVPRLQDRLGGATLKARVEQGRHVLCVADILRRFPTGLLYGSGAALSP